MGIKSKVLITNFITYLVYMFIAIASVAFIIRTQLTQAAQQENKVIVESIGTVILQDFLKFERTVSYLSQEQGVMNFLENPSIENYDQVGITVGNALAGSDDYDFAYVLDTEGLTLFSTDPSILYNNYDFRPYFQSAIEGNITISSAIGVTTNEPGFYASAPVFETIDGNRSIIGVVVIKFRPELLFDTIEQSDLDNVSINDISLADSNGLIFETNDEDQLYKTVGLPSISTIAKIEDFQLLNSNRLQYLNYNKAQEFIEQRKEGYMQVDEEGDTNLSSSIFKIPGFNYYVFSQFNFGDYGSALQNILLLVVGMVPLILMIGAFITSRIISRQVDFFDKFLSSLQSALNNKAKLVLDTDNVDLKLTQDAYNNFVESYHQSNKDSQADEEVTDVKNEIEELKKKNQRLTEQLQETEKFSNEISTLLKNNKKEED
ncbi:hypothetical protein KC678_01375 [Candidatus Dojkabacteria bacterium]|uniref:Cache domain-containing protein n=1 Tax=Candidatus Dojkabacteria bacterium TaxID=2099670 RepID=A0A955IF18_9BACT|nr:hypothetical protein [Candidatus Dojkabacteria bacterium]